MKATSRLLFFVFVLAGLTAASAQPVTWSTTPVDSGLNNLSNWTAAPANADLVFGSTSRSFLSLTASLDVNSITFSGSYPSFTFSSQNSSALGIGAGGIAVGVQTGSIVTFSETLSVDLLANQTWAINGPLTVRSSIYTSSPFTVTKTGAGDLTLKGFNNFNGITVQQGALYLGGKSIISAGTLTGGPAGTGAITLASGTTLGAANPITTTDNSIDNEVVLGSSGATNNVTLATRRANDINPDHGESLKLNGKVTAGSATTTVHLAGEQPVKLTGSITGPANTALTFDSATGGFSGVIISASFNANIASVTADNAAVLFVTAPPASVMAANRGYIGVAATDATVLPALSPNLVLSSIAAGNRATFAGTFGFDTDNDSLHSANVVTENLDFSAFTHADFRIGSMTTSVLSGTITPPTVGSVAAYRFGGSSGKLAVKSNLADATGAPASVTVTAFAGTDAPLVLFQGNNTFSGSTTLDGVTARLAVERSIAILGSPTALPGGAASKIALGAGSAAYIGATESAGFKSFADFTGHLAVGGYNASSILGLDSDNYFNAKIAGGRSSSSYSSRTIIEPIDLRSFSPVYFGTASALEINSTIFAPSGGELKLTTVSGGHLTINAAFGGNVTSLVVGMGGSVSAEFSSGALILRGDNTYTGGTTLKSGALLFSDTTKLTSSGAIISSPIGTGTLTVENGINTSIIAAHDYGTTVYNPVVLNGVLQIGAREFSTDGSLHSVYYNPLNLAGVISGTGQLSIYGTVDLRAANTFSGGTSIDFGRVNFGSASAFGTGPIKLNGGSTSSSGPSSVMNFAELSADNSVSLTQAVSMGGAIALGSTSGTLDLAGNVTLAAPTFINVHTSAGSAKISGAVGGANSLNLITGNLSLSGTNSYSGGTIVTGGTLLLENAGAIPASGFMRSVGSGYIGAGFSTGLQAGFLDRFSKSSTGGTIGFDSTSSISEALDFSNFNPSVRLGSAKSATLTGTLTPTTSGTNYNFGNGGGTLTVQSDLSTSRGVSVSSAAETPLTLVLKGTNTYTGGTFAERSVVRFDSATALPAGGLLNATDYGYVGYTENTGLTPAAFLARFTSTIGANAILGFDSSTSSSQTISGAIALTNFASSTYIGSSTSVIINGAITPVGGTTGVLNLTGVKGGSLVLNSPVTSNSLVLGTPYKAISAASTVTLNAASAFSGGTTLNFGHVIVGDQAALGTGTVTVASDGTSLSTNSTAPGFALANNFDLSTSTGTRKPVLAIDGPNSIKLAGTISGSGELTKSGSGSLTLSAVNSAFAGLIEIYGGDITFSADASAGTGGLSFASSGGAIANFLSAAPSIGQLSGYDPLDQINLAINSTLTVRPQYDGDYAGIITGSGAKLLIESATSSSPVYFGLQGANTYTGGTTIGANTTLVATNSGALGTTGTVTLNGGTLAVHGGATLAFSSTPNHLLMINDGALAGSGTYSFDTNLTIKGSTSGNATLAPGIHGSIGQLNLSFSPGSKLILAGGGSYAWKLLDPSNSASGWDSLNVAGAVDVTATSANPFNLRIGTVDADGNSSFVGNLDLASTYSWTLLTATSITGFDASLFAIDRSDFLNFGSFSLTENAAHTSLILNFTPSAVPEPSTWALMMAGLAIISTLSLRRRKAA